MSLHQPCPGRRSLAGLLGALTWSLEELVVERCYDLLTPAAFQAMGACKGLKARPKPKPNPKTTRASELAALWELVHAQRARRAARARARQRAPWPCPRDRSASGAPTERAAACSVPEELAGAACMRRLQRRQRRQRLGAQPLQRSSPQPGASLAGHTAGARLPKSRRQAAGPRPCSTRV